MALNSCCTPKKKDVLPNPGMLSIAQGDCLDRFDTLTRGLIFSQFLLNSLHLICLACNVFFYNNIDIFLLFAFT